LTLTTVDDKEVRPVIVVEVLPRGIAVLPIVTGVAKLASKLDKGILATAPPNVYGTAI